MDKKETSIVSTHAVSSMGFEPTTLGLLDPRSNQLSYEDRVDMTLSIWGSNP